MGRWATVAGFICGWLVKDAWTYSVFSSESVPDETALRTVRAAVI